MLLSKPFLLTLLLSGGLLADTVPQIKKIIFEGNQKITAKKLTHLTKEYQGKSLDTNTSQAIAKAVEAYYHRNNYPLAYANVQKIDINTSSVVISIKKYADFNERAIGEMKHCPIQEGAINQIFFTGNEKISTYLLTQQVKPMIGKKNAPENIQTVLDAVQNYYRSHHYELAYTEISSIDTNGILTIAVKKYPNFKVRYASEGKN